MLSNKITLLFQIVFVIYLNYEGFVTEQTTCSAKPSRIINTNLIDPNRKPNKTITQYGSYNFYEPTNLQIVSCSNGTNTLYISSQAYFAEKDETFFITIDTFGNVTDIEIAPDLENRLPKTILLSNTSIYMVLYKEIRKYDFEYNYLNQSIVIDDESTLIYAAYFDNETNLIYVFLDKEDSADIGVAIYNEKFEKINFFYLEASCIQLLKYKKQLFCLDGNNGIVALENNIIVKIYDGICGGDFYEYKAFYIDDNGYLLISCTDDNRKTRVYLYHVNGTYTGKYMDLYGVVIGFNVDSLGTLWAVFISFDFYQTSGLQMFN